MRKRDFSRTMNGWGSGSADATTKAIGCEPRLRMAGDKPFTTDSGNYIIDCLIGDIPDAAALDARLCAIIGVVESGLFVGLASKIVVGRSAGVEIMAR